MPNPKERWIKAVKLIKEKDKEQVKKTQLVDILKGLNTVVYRTKYKKNSLVKLISKTENGILDPKKFLFLDKKYFDLYKVVSKPSDSASNSVVLLIKKNKKQFILKLTFVTEKENMPLNFPDTERKFYEIMDVVVKKKITPHVFIFVDSFEDSLPVDNMIIHPATVRFLNQNSRGTTKPHVYPILTETCDDDSQAITLKNTLENLYKSNIPDKTRIDIFINILFQIIYTIESFIRIGIKHNDLHSGNVFILHRPHNILKGNHDRFNRKYEYRDYLKSSKKNTVLLPNIGLDVRIYDFDRSCKAQNDFRYYPDSLESIFMKKFKEYSNCKPNRHHDTFKILCHIYFSKICTGGGISGKRIELLRQLIESYFPEKSVLLNGKLGRKNIEYILNGYRYYLLKDEFPNKLNSSYRVMLENIEILNNLAIWVNSPRDTKNFSVTSKSFLEEYSLENIKTSEKERVVKTIKARQFARDLQQKKTKLKTPSKKKVVFKVKKSVKSNSPIMLSPLTPSSSNSLFNISTNVNSNSNRSKVTWKGPYKNKFLAGLPKDYTKKYGKKRLTDLEEAKRRSVEMGTESMGVTQKDKYFSVRKGSKLKESPSGETSWIKA